MLKTFKETGISVFSTCPQSKDLTPELYLQNVIDVAQWSERAGCEGILVYTDNGIADPWVVSQTILSNTEMLAPLVAVQPIYMHPYTAAKIVSTMGLMYNRRIYLNMLAGGFKNDLIALGDNTPHDDRYKRTTEYTLIIKKLLATTKGVTFKGKYYSIENLKMTPALAENIQPGILISGSSEAGLQAAKDIDGIAVQYPKPFREYEENPVDPDINAGVRVGIIARESKEEAWKVAHERFPGDRKGQIAHKLAMKVSDSKWHEQLSDLADKTSDGDTPYWMFPFQNYKTFCPYLVGDFKEVANEIAGYISVGYKTFILDIPANHEELEYINRVFSYAVENGVKG